MAYACAWKLECTCPEAAEDGVADRVRGAAPVHAPASARKDRGNACWFCRSKTKGAKIINSEGQLSDLAAAARTGLGDRRTQDRAAEFVAASRLDETPVTGETTTMSAQDIMAHPKCMAAFVSDMCPVATTPAGKKNELTQRDLNAACAHAKEMLAKPGVSVLPWPDFVKSLAEGPLSDRAADRAGVVRGWRKQLEAHFASGGPIVVCQTGTGTGARHFVWTRETAGKAAAALYAAESAGDDAAAANDVLLNMKAADVTTEVAMSRAALELRGSFGSMMRSKRDAARMETSAALTLEKMEERVPKCAVNLMFQVLTGKHHSELVATDPTPPEWLLAVVHAAHLSYSVTRQYTPLQVGLASFMRANKVPQRVTDALNRFGMTATHRHARELENAVAADGRFAALAILQQYVDVYGQDLQIFCSYDNCDHAVMGALGATGLQFSHVNGEITIYRKSGLPITLIGAAAQTVRSRISALIQYKHVARTFTILYCVLCPDDRSSSRPARCPRCS